MRGLLPSSVLSLHHHRGLADSTTSSCWHELRRAWFRAAHRWSCALRMWVRAQQSVWQRCYRIPAAAVPLKCEDEKFKTTCDGLSLQRKYKRGKACFSWVISYFPPFFSSSACVQDGSLLASPPAAIRPHSAGGFRFPIRLHSGDGQQYWLIDKQYKNFRKLHQPLHFLHCCRAFGVCPFRSSHRNRGWLVTGRDISVHRRPLDSGSGPLFTGV